MKTPDVQPVGVLILGGRGTRLLPLTETVNKHFLPVYDKPMFYYPLSMLLLAGCREIIIVSNVGDEARIRSSIESLELSNIKFEFLQQDYPLGIVDAMETARHLLTGREFWLALGDNLLFGPGLGRGLASIKAVGKCRSFSTTSRNPERFGSVLLDLGGNPLEIREKAPRNFSNQVLTGLYLFPSHTFELIAQVEISSRGEKEITDLLTKFMQRKELLINRLPLGTTWIDLGTFDDLHDASSLVRLHQTHSGEKLGDPRRASQAAALEREVGTKS
jgi:glucose-1-phosphate thymidylyltransferase